jgi:hypothetical protein
MAVLVVTRDGFESILTTAKSLVFNANSFSRAALFSSCCKFNNTRARIFKRLRSPGIDSKESIPPAYEAWRAGTIALFLLGS